MAHEVKNPNPKMVLEQLARLYPNARTELAYENTFQLLIAVMLSAQCTDKQVNKVTSRLFKKYGGPEDFAALAPEELAEEIKECGLFRNKSKNIVNACRLLVECFGSRVPDRLEDLQILPGVGRKTANVVLNIAYGKPAMPVDTHVFRLARRLGLSRSRTPESVEKDLLSLIPPDSLGDVHHRLIYHGRAVCKARKPRCGECSLSVYCPGRSQSQAGPEGV